MAHDAMQKISSSFDVGCLDDGPPPLDLGFLEGGERFRRLLIARRKLSARDTHPWPRRVRAGGGARPDA
jgi:hypothetical protein